MGYFPNLKIETFFLRQARIRSQAGSEYARFARIRNPVRKTLSDPDRRKGKPIQIDRLAEFKRPNRESSPHAPQKIREDGIDNENGFEKPVDAVRHCPPGQICNVPCEAGGQYRRNMYRFSLSGNRAIASAADHDPLLPGSSIQASQDIEIHLVRLPRLTGFASGIFPCASRRLSRHPVATACILPIDEPRFETLSMAAGMLEHVDGFKVMPRTQENAWTDQSQWEWIPKPWKSASFPSGSSCKVSTLADPFRSDEAEKESGVAPVRSSPQSRGSCQYGDNPLFQIRK